MYTVREFAWKVHKTLHRKKFIIADWSEHYEEYCSKYKSYKHYIRNRDDVGAGKTAQKPKAVSLNAQHIVSRKTVKHHMLCPKKQLNEFSDGLWGGALELLCCAT